MSTTLLQIRAIAELERRKRVNELEEEIPNNYQDWLPYFFPNLFYHSFTTRHTEFWQHIESIEPGIKPPAFFAIWPRASGKTTNTEAAAVRLGATGKKHFCLYTRSTQDKANESVSNIAAMLESRRVSLYYPELSQRKIGRYGNSKGWKVNVLRCANDFSVAALGYDAAVRGIKFEEYRPDLIIVDDIDDKRDTIETINKKIETLTRDILPAGSADCAVIGIQNLIGYAGIFTQLANGKADFLRDRIVSGPYQAIDGLKYQYNDSENIYKITGGEATWEGQGLEICQQQLNEWGPTAFIQEAQNIVVKKEGRVYHSFKGPGPASYELDLSKAEGFYHSHDFGAVNHVWGLWAKIGKKYYLIHSEKLPEGTTESRAQKIKSHFEGRRIIAGWGGAQSEKQFRSDFSRYGVSIRLPSNTDVESQIGTTNGMLDNEELVICSDQLEVIDQLENCIRDAKEGIADKHIWHFCDMCRYFGAGIKSGGWVR